MTQFVAADEPQQLSLLTARLQSEWSMAFPQAFDRDEYEWVLDYQRPGGISTVVLDIEMGTLSLEQVDDGLVALINDLHKGRHSGAVWRVLIDLIAVLCIFFSVTGLLLLWVHAKKRGSTWPLVGSGLMLPLLVYYFWVP